MLEPGRNCWRVERAERASLVVDAADYFHLARKAMLRAEKQILLIGWDFDTRICLDYEADDGAPAELGTFLSWLPKNRPGLQIHILKWDLGAIKLLGRGTTVLRLARWAASNQIHFKLDGAHAVGASHHHKIVVIDDRFAFCGGIDMTADRWDTRGHVDDDEHRRRPTTHRHYGPWHDATMAVDGKVAAALGEHARSRWEAAGGEPIDPPKAASDPWPEELEPQFRDVDIAIARTRGEYDEEECVREIEALYVDMIKTRETLRLCREPIFRVAGHRQGDLRTPVGGRPAGDRDRQSAQRRRLAGRCGDERRAGPADGGRAQVRQARPLPSLLSGDREARGHLRPFEDHHRRRSHDPRRVGQHEQPVDGSRQRVRPADRCRSGNEQGCREDDCGAAGRSAGRAPGRVGGHDRCQAGEDRFADQDDRGVQRKPGTRACPLRPGRSRRRRSASSPRARRSTPKARARRSSRWPGPACWRGCVAERWRNRARAL